jgi:stress-induced morphogen
LLVENSIREKLSKAFAPSRLSVENESAKHAHHAGMAGHSGAGSGETHFRVIVVSERFQGQSRVERHRQVNDILKEELAGPVHALAIRALTPEEAKS